MNLPDFLDPEKIVPVSRGTSLIFKTGTWGNRVPVCEEKASPCREACPAGNNIPDALTHLSKGDVDQTLASFLEENPLPGVCGHVCYHPCEGVCNRGQWDEAVGIRALERAAAAYGEAEPKLLSREGESRPVAVVGSGPAGLSAAYYLTRLGHPVTVFDREDLPGGMMRYGIPAYRLPGDVLEKDLKRIFSLGIVFCGGAAVDRGFIARLQRDYAAIFLALGAHRSLMPELPGIEWEGARAGLEFLKEVKMGLTRRLSGKVIVIGGGNVAIDVAMTARRLGAGEVILTCLEGRGEMPAHADEISDAEEEGITFVNGWGPKRILGKDGKVEGVELLRCKSVFDSRGEFAPVFDVDEPRVIGADILVFAVGQAPDLDRYNLAELFRGMETDAIGTRWSCAADGRSLLFAGGDVVGSPGTVTEAVAAGKQAALSIHLRTTGKEISTEGIRLGSKTAFSIEAWAHLRPYRDLGKVVTFEAIDPVFLEHARSVTPPRRLPAVRQRDFGVIEETLTREAAIEGAGRCFSCGVCTRCDACFLFCPDICIRPPDGEREFYRPDVDYCKGCALCVDVCPRGIITMGEKE